MKRPKLLKLEILKIVATPGLLCQRKHRFGLMRGLIISLLYSILIIIVLKDLKVQV